jgi:hypothetical protein
VKQSIHLNFLLGYASFKNAIQDIWGSGREWMSSSTLEPSADRGGLGLDDFGCVLDLGGRYQIGDGSDGQVVGLNAALYP